MQKLFYNYYSHILPITMLAIMAATLSPAQADNVAKGTEIAARFDQSDAGFSDNVATATMVLKNASGKSAKRRFVVLTLERNSGKAGDKSISIFQTPKDIKGTAVLTHAKLLANDDQWIYLPAAKRVKRISSSNKSGPFVGSEFAYEDIAGQELGKYKYNWLKSEKCKSGICDVVERAPLYKNSGYSKQHVWFDQKLGQIRRIDFYNRSGDLAKRLIFSKYKNITGFWRAHLLSMKNMRNNKSTNLVFSDIKFKTGLKSRDFRSGSLKNLRW